MRLYLFLILFPLFVSGQNTHYFNRILSNDTTIMLSTCVLPIDSGYLVTGIYNPTPVGDTGAYTSAIFLQELDSLGNEIDFHYLDSEIPGETRQLTTPNRGSQFIECSDGNFMMAYVSAPELGVNDRDINYTKFTKKGEILWSKKIEGPTKQVVQTIIETSDKGFLLAGFNNIEPIITSHFYAVKTDSLGNIEWEITQPMGGLQSAVFSTLETSSGGFILSGGAYYEETDYDLQLLKLNADGNYEWEKHYDVNNWENCAAILVKYLDGYLISTCIDDPNIGGNEKRHYVLKLDSEFEVVWEHVYPFEEDWFTISDKPIVEEDGSFVQAGRFTDGPNQYPYIRKFSPEGEIEWTWKETLAEDFLCLSRDLEKTPDGGYVMAAFQFTGWQRGWLVKVDSMGQTCSYLGCDSTVLAPIPIDTMEDTTDTFIDALPFIKPSFIKISPNPAKRFATVFYEIPDLSPFVKLRLYNSLGELVLVKELATSQNQERINVEHLSDGLYVWEILFEGKRLETGKLIVR